MVLRRKQPVNRTGCLLASCKINDINPHTWLRDVLFRLTSQLWNL
ncbi:MAG: transposase domain-containing protein [Saprospiraceae bacterium]